MCAGLQCLLLYFILFGCIEKCNRAADAVEAAVLSAFYLCYIFFSELVTI